MTSTLDSTTHADPAAAASAPRYLLPGKLGMWVFLATEVMFFTGLIGSYIVLRASSPPTAYSNLYPPGSLLTRETLRADLRTSSWPRPYDAATNPLSIDLTALNTFVLICSSLTMVLALSAIQRGDRKRCSRFLLATLLLGCTFLGVQVYEYNQLMNAHHYPVGVSASGHFRPDTSLFASCFFTLTGFHGLHVLGGIMAIVIVWLGSLAGRFNRERHAAVEMVGLYWHFVDLVWILLFTVVYLI